MKNPESMSEAELSEMLVLARMDHDEATVQAVLEERTRRRSNPAQTKSDAPKTPSVKTMTKAEYELQRKAAGSRTDGFSGILK